VCRTRSLDRKKEKKDPKKVLHMVLSGYALIWRGDLCCTRSCVKNIYICRKEGEEEEKGNEYSMCFHFGCVFCLWVVSMCVCVLCVSVYGVFCACNVCECA